MFRSWTVVSVTVAVARALAFLSANTKDKGPITSAKTLFKR